jgi:hypothetical protein
MEYKKHSVKQLPIDNKNTVGPRFNGIVGASKISPLNRVFFIPKSDKKF